MKTKSNPESNKKPVLIIMAAGMGSRYGSLKQLDKLDENGHVMMDYALYDAYVAGFRRVIFVIKPEMQNDFEEQIGKRLRNHYQIDYAFQVLENLPDGFSVPEGRTKPWGTAHAVLSAKDLVNGPFVVINADDYYGRTAFEAIFNFLSEEQDPDKHAMVGYRIENTLTENGYVSRGVCETDENGNLTGIVERLKIVKADGGATIQEESGDLFIPNGTYVSMNLWGFQKSLMQEINDTFADYLRVNLPVNPLKCEYFLPLIPNKLITEKRATFKVLPTQEKWYGVTYKEDKEPVMAALKRFRDNGKYPEKLWENQ